MVTKNNRFTTTCLVPFVFGVFLIGCGKPASRLDVEWTPPITISSSIAGLGGSAWLHRYQDTIMGEQVLKDGSTRILLRNPATGSWSEACLSDVPNKSWGASGLDPDSGKILLAECYAENEQAVLNTFTAAIDQSLKLQRMAMTTWTKDKASLLGETGPKIKLNAYAKHEGIGLGPCFVSGSDMCIPYCLHATTFFGINNARDGPFNNGVFHSGDAGKTWQMEKIADFDSLAPEVCKTKEHYYYFGIGTPILGQGVWASRKPISGKAWETASMVAETFAYVSGRYAVAGDGDTAHICWMDRRHNKRRFDYGAPPIENNDIYYRHRKDSDREWSKEVHLSKGLLYCYAPRISVEGKKIVVVWAGIRTADKHHTDMGANDIYYVTSKDAGKTWTPPLRITDGAKDGITAGMPQVALLNGTIHLLYVQGARRSPTELSPGLTKLG